MSMEHKLSEDVRAYLRARNVIGNKVRARYQSELERIVIELGGTLPDRAAIRRAVTNEHDSGHA